eukprot:3599542-Rhodomonas_salina.1
MSLLFLRLPLAIEGKRRESIEPVHTPWSSKHEDVEISLATRQEISLSTRQRLDQISLRFAEPLPTTSPSRPQRHSALKAPIVDRKDYSCKRHVHFGG